MRRIVAQDANRRITQTGGGASGSGATVAAPPVPDQPESGECGDDRQHATRPPLRRQPAGVGPAQPCPDALEILVDRLASHPDFVG
jgi:hypothetical protein